MTGNAHWILLSATGWEAIAASSVVVQFVLFLLIALSITTWAIILYKGVQLRRATRETEEFLEHFWESKNFESAAELARDLQNSPVSTVFLSAFRDLKLFRKEKETVGMGEDTLMRDLVRTGSQGLQRTIQSASIQEHARLEGYLSFLGTVASAAPFIGLFGTVWGIMDAFAGIGQSGSASLAVVSGPISEALIATATGLAAAIPAAAAYNYLLGQVRRLQIDMENFGLELLNLSERYFLR